VNVANDKKYTVTNGGPQARLYELKCDSARDCFASASDLDDTKKWKPDTVANWVNSTP
jgi:hypothetical protein